MTGHHRHFSFYFTEKSKRKYLFYFACLIYVIAVALIVIAEPLIPIPCDNEESNQPTQLVFKNVLFHYTPCIAEHRYPHLLYLTRMECRKARHLLLAVFLGCMIGYERRQNDRPAGIRTMGLVSLGSCLFTINSTFAFLEGPMSWDASRVSAAIPSGVGFLGAGLIIKATEKDPITGESHHLIQGITTAAATWLSAAVGLACGGGLYFIAIFSTAVNLILLRFGPRFNDDDECDDDSADLEAFETMGADYNRNKGNNGRTHGYGGTDDEKIPLSKDLDDLLRKNSMRSTRKKPTLT